MYDNIAGAGTIVSAFASLTRTIARVRARATGARDVRVRVGRVTAFAPGHGPGRRGQRTFA